MWIASKDVKVSGGTQIIIKGIVILPSFDSLSELLRNRLHSGREGYEAYILLKRSPNQKKKSKQMTKREVKKGGGRISN